MIVTRGLQLLSKGLANGRNSPLARSVSTIQKPLSMLIVDGYSDDGRADLEAGGASTAGKLYREMLAKCTPGGNVECDVIYPSDESFSMPDLSNYHAVAWTGCSLTVHKTDDPRVARQLKLADEIFEVGLPQFGSCWAAQIAVAAAGGVCAANPRGREMGLSRKIILSPEGRAHPMFEGKPSVFDAFTSHNDEITHVQPGTLCLASNAFTNIQAVALRHKKGDFWAVQYHPEYDLHELARLTYCRMDRLVSLGFFESKDDCLQYVDDLENLHMDPNRYDLAWKLGIDADVMDENIRYCELRNFIHKLALPQVV